MLVFSDDYPVWINETHRQCLIARIPHRNTYFLGPIWSLWLVSESSEEAKCSQLRLSFLSYCHWWPFMHLWLLFQLLVIKGAIIMTASSVLWWWAAMFPLITPSHSLIYCQPSSLCHAAISCLRGRELAWKTGKNQQARGEIDTSELCVWWIRKQPFSTKASECEWAFSLHNIVSKQESKRTSGILKMGSNIVKNTCKHADLMFHPTCSNCRHLFSLII